MLSILKSTRKGLTLHDERGRMMEFPRRQDYIRQLQEHGLVSDEAGFVADDGLTEAVYLDWLLRPQVGCVFAQLLARPVLPDRSEDCGGARFLWPQRAQAS